MHAFPFPKFFKVETTTHFPMRTSLREQTEQANKPKAELGSKKENV